ncbi:hypothetical protein ACQR7C_15705 [Salmonella enterica]|uniref:hypothetical protein n=1 Tax=Salmonella enterica TaxID=28901 RepID=UPI003D2EE1D7
MKDGIKINAPAPDSTGKSVDLVLKALALMIVLYGVAKLFPPSHNCFTEES